MILLLSIAGIINRVEKGKIMKISEAFDAYKNNYMFYKSKSKRSLQNQEYVKNRIIDFFGDIELSEMTLDGVQEWAVELLDGRCWNTARNDILRLRSVLRYMRTRGVDCLNCDLIPVPTRENKTRDFLTPYEVKAMIDCSDQVRTKFIISLFYSSGIRLAELLSLDRDDIKNRKFSVIGKGNKERLCFIDERTEDLMYEYLATREDDCPALIVSRLFKERMTSSTIQLIVKNAAISAGIKKHVTPHVLRHSFATNFLTNNGNLRYLSALLGHSSVNTTMIYAHVVDNDLENQYKKFHTV